MKESKRQVRNKDVVKNQRMVHLSIPPRMEGDTKSTRTRSKKKPGEIHKPRKGK
ncbi:hypothetical protein KW800_01665 [Candidatus Parcubacteria bacterium]|nr:hypothetical protein [Candidatus Parcubacteria bacterium]